MGPQPSWPDVVEVAGLDLVRIDRGREVGEREDQLVAPALDCELDYVFRIASVGVTNDVLTRLVEGEHDVRRPPSTAAGE